MRAKAVFFCFIFCGLVIHFCLAAGADPRSGSLRPWKIPADLLRWKRPRVSRLDVDGLRVVILPERSVPLVSVSLFLPNAGGGRSVTDVLLGAAVLRKGPPGWTSDERRRFLARNGLRFRVMLHDTCTEIRLDGPERALEAALGFLEALFSTETRPIPSIEEKRMLSDMLARREAVPLTRVMDRFFERVVWTGPTDDPNEGGPPEAEDPMRDWYASLSRSRLVLSVSAPPALEAIEDALNAHDGLRLAAFSSDPPRAMRPNPTRGEATKGSRGRRRYTAPDFEVVAADRTGDAFAAAISGLTLDRIDARDGVIADVLARALLRLAVRALGEEDVIRSGAGWRWTGPDRGVLQVWIEGGKGSALEQAMKTAWREGAVGAISDWHAGHARVAAMAAYAERWQEDAARAAALRLSRSGKDGASEWETLFALTPADLRSMARRLLGTGARVRIVIAGGQ